MKVLTSIKNLFKPADLTKGNVVKVLLVFMIPIMLCALFQKIYTFVDAAIIGMNCDSEIVAGVNACGPLVIIFLQFAIGCASGFSVILSARVGIHDEDGIRKSFVHQIVILAFITIILTAVGLICIDPLLKLVGLDPAKGANYAAEYEAAKTYLTIIYSGIFSTTFYNMIVAVLRALGDSLAPFLFLFAGVFLNLGLDILFIAVFRWGAAGAAAATVASQSIAVIGSYVYALIKYKALRIRFKDFKIEWGESLNHLKMGLPLGFQFSILMIGVIVMQSTVIMFDHNPAGDLVDLTPCQIGYGAATKIFDFMTAPLESLGIACLSFAGQNSGAHQEDRLKKGFKTAVVIELVSWAIVSIIALLLTINGTYIRILVSSENITQATIDYGNRYLYTVIPFMCILSLLYLGRNYLQGLQRPLWPFVAGIVELVSRIAVCLTLPYLVNGGTIDCNANYWSYFFTCSADWMAWLTAGSLLMIASIRTLFFPPKGGKKRPTIASTEN